MAEAHRISNSNCETELETSSSPDTFVCLTCRIFNRTNYRYLINSPRLNYKGLNDAEKCSVEDFSRRNTKKLQDLSICFEYYLLFIVSLVNPHITRDDLFKKSIKSVKMFVS